MMDGQILSGKVALVAGGSGGIGSAVAVALAEAGADVGLTYRSGWERARTVVEAIEKQDRRSLALEVDVRRRADVEKAVASVASEPVKKSFATGRQALVSMRSFFHERTSHVVCIAA
jgi:NAD(P)-dependent dehydrogenase (short-subunit alcohol dehydrogenase family)